MQAAGRWWTATGSGVRLTVHVSPGARRSEVVGVVEDALRVRVAAPPVEGKANRELSRVLARAFGVAPRAVTVVRGDSSRRKLVDITGGDDLTAVARLLDLPPPQVPGASPAASS
jgi:uncharacterized protein (TIGR00251 family)